MKYSYFDHPNQVCLTYYQHWNLSMYFARTLFIGSFKAVIHAFIPSLYKTHTSDLTKHIAQTLEETRCTKSTKSIEQDNTQSQKS